MTENRFKRKPAEGGTAFGALMFEFSTAGIARICASKSGLACTPSRGREKIPVGSSTSDERR